MAEQSHDKANVLIDASRLRPAPTIQRETAAAALNVGLMLVVAFLLLRGEHAAYGLPFLGAGLLIVAIRFAFGLRMWRREQS